MGTRQVPFSRVLFIEQDDFIEDPPKKYFRLAPGQEVRLRYAYYITCVNVIKNEAGEIVELRCVYDPESRGGTTPDGRKVRGTLHWVSAQHSIPAEVRLYDRLFNKENPDAGGADFTEHLNSGSLEILSECRMEPSLASAEPGSRYQFERLGYFCAEPVEFSKDRPVFNRTVTLKDSWARIAQKR
jgi:glutaminyl-tRNA synthetase